jgi:hypothetical protein
LVDNLDDVLSLPGLREAAESRVRRLTSKEISDALFFDLPSVVADHTIGRYARSRSFDEANTWGN